MLIYIEFNMEQFNLNSFNAECLFAEICDFQIYLVFGIFVFFIHVECDQQQDLKKVFE